MAEIDSIISAVCSVLSEKTGNTSVKIFPAGAKKRYEDPVITVGLKAGSGVSAGFAEYLGERYDERTSSYFETYGKRLELTLGIDVYSPNNSNFGADKCLEIVSVIMGAVPEFQSGIRVKKITCGETGFDMSTGMFLCPVEMECTCVFYAEKLDDEELTAFRLRGEMVRR